MKSIQRKISSLVKTLRAKWKLVLILLIIAGGLIFWQVRQANGQKEEQVFAPVGQMDLTKTLDISGIVDAKEKARMKFLAGGKVVYLGAKEGEWVKKWQTIASIDKAALKKALDQDLNTYMKERWDFETSQDATNYHVESQAVRKSLDKEQWDLQNEVLDVEIRDIAIKESSLYAPFAGVLVKAPTAVTGVQLLATDVFEIVNPASLIFRAEVDESDIGLLTLGQPAQLEIDAYPDEIIETQLSYISYSSSISSTGTVFLVEFPLGSEDLNKFRIGLNGDAKIILDSRQNVLAVPLEATISRDGKTYVTIKNAAGKTEEREITTGLETDDEVEVLSGLSGGELVLIPE